MNRSQRPVYFLLRWSFAEVLSSPQPTGSRDYIDRRSSLTTNLTLGLVPRDRLLVVRQFYGFDIHLALDPLEQLSDAIELADVHDFPSPNRPDKVLLQRCHYDGLARTGYEFDFYSLAVGVPVYNGADVSGLETRGVVAFVSSGQSVRRSKPIFASTASMTLVDTVGPTGQRP